MSETSKSITAFIADRSKELRKAKKIKQEDILHDTGIHVGRIEQGNRDLSITSVERLCEYLGVTISEFFSTYEKLGEEPESL